MKTDVLEVWEDGSSNFIPDGTYDGTWTAFRVRFEAHGVKYSGNTKEGVRGMNVPCRVKVWHGILTVSVRAPAE